MKGCAFLAQPYVNTEGLRWKGLPSKSAALHAIFSATLLLFFTSGTCPDIAYVVSRLSRYTHNPSLDHWKALKTLLRYLRGTVDWGIKLYGVLTVLEGYYDANWLTDSDEVSSTSGYVFTLNGGTLSWKSAKQTCITRSTMEVEFIALDLATQKAD